jgi:iron(III) transport system substrate-binding protein
MVAMGEMSTGVLGAADAIRYIRDGFPLALTLPKENPGYQLFAAALLAGAPHSEEAQQFLDWLISAEGQALLYGSGFHYYPSNINVKPVPELAPLKDVDLSTFNPIDAAENRIKFIEKWNVDIRMGRIIT